MLSDDTLDIIWTVLAKGHFEALCTFFTLCREAILVFAVNFWGLLAMADEINNGVSLLGISAAIEREQKGKCGTIFGAECGK
jgi:hypothetical protein